MRQTFPNRPPGAPAIWTSVFPLGPALAVLLCGSTSVAATISLTDAQREKLARLIQSNSEAAQLFQRLKKRADAALDDPARPLVRIETAGKLESDPAKVESRAGLKDMKKLEALGYAYAVTSNPVYSTAVKRVILSWARTNQPTGQPIDETKLEPLFVAYDLTRPVFDAEDRAVIESWLRTIARRELDGVRVRSITASNNWNSHRLKIVGMIGFLLNDRDLIDRAVSGFKRQIEVNLKPDGSSLDFHERDALHYHCYSLEPLLALAIVAQQNGIDLYHYRAPSGASLPNSVSFLVPYCDGTLSHPEWRDSKVKFDRERAAAGEEKFRLGVSFDPRSGQRVFEMASFFDDQFKPLVSRLAGNSGAEYPTWQSLVNDAGSR
jgi:hypothetical protein